MWGEVPAATEGMTGPSELCTRGEDDFQWFLLRLTVCGALRFDDLSYDSMHHDHPPEMLMRLVEFET